MRLYLASEMTPEVYEKSASYSKVTRHAAVSRTLTSIGVAGEVRAPLDVGAVGMGASSDGVAADGAQDTGVGKLRGRGNDAVGDHVVDGLCRGQHLFNLFANREVRTLCSSCLTSYTVPSLKVHRKMSASSLVLVTTSDLDRADQKLLKC